MKAGRSGYIDPLSDIELRPVDRLAATVAIVIWGLNLVVGKVGLAQVPPLALTAARFALVTLLLSPFLRRPPGSPWLVLALGLVFGAGHFGLMFAGLAGVDAALAAIVIQLGVPFSAALAVAVDGERLSGRQLIGMMVAFLGVALLAGTPGASSSRAHVLMLCGASLAWAVASLMLRRLGHVSPFALNAWIGVLATPLLAAGSALFEESPLAALRSADWRAWGAVLFMAVGASIIAHGAWYRLLGRYPVARIAPLTLLAPALGVVFAVVLLGEPLGLHRAAGGLVTIGGVAMIQVGQTRRLPRRTA